MANEIFGEGAGQLFDSVASETKSIISDATKGNAGSGFSFPILEDPSQIFGVLLGEPAVLVTYDMDPLIFDFEYSQFFSAYSSSSTAGSRTR